MSNRETLQAIARNYCSDKNLQGGAFGTMGPLNKRKNLTGCSNSENGRTRGKEFWKKGELGKRV